MLSINQNYSDLLSRHQIICYVGLSVRSSVCVVLTQDEVFIFLTRVTGVGSDPSLVYHAL